MKTSHFLIYSASALALAATGVAQEDDETLRQEKVVVTGSFIAGTPEDAALPVDVVTAGELRLEGSPSVTELIRNLGVSSGVDGQTNQFASNGLEGTSNINLRGLGPGRTLVLLNGRRQVFSPYGVGEQAQLFVDTNMIPSAAIGRIEVLKDGAAALYGSDAIAGVVNFITRDDLEGLELSGSYETFEGSDGEYDLSAAFGLQGDNWSWITSAGYQYRSEVPFLEKDWAIVPFEENEVAGWSTIGNPGSFVATPNVGIGGAVAGTPLAFANADPNCETVGGVDGGVLCRFQFLQFDNLVEEEERYQLFSEYNREFANGTEFHVEALYGRSEVPQWKTSPSYPPQSLFGQVVAPNHPGLQQIIADNPTWAAETYTDYNPLGAGGAPVVGGLDTATTPLIFFGRSFGWGGFPGTGGAQEGSREYDSYRLAGSLKGDFENGVNWDVGVSWGRTEGERVTNDTYIEGFAAALQGFGVCVDPITGLDPSTGTDPLSADYAGSLVAGQGGCEYYNPFSNAIAESAITGEANPGYVPGLENSVTLAEWLTEGNGTNVTTDLLVFDAVMSGESNIQTSGGTVGWAAGVQVRREGYEVDPFEVTDLAETPGPEGNGPFSFLAGTNAADEDQTIYSVFGELQVPLYDNLDIQVAMRYEDYGGEVGSTFDPKFAAKWQATNNLALRGSAQTSFKGPTLNQLSGQVTTLQFIAPTGAFKAVDQFGNENLNPESAFSYNFGAIFQQGGFTASLDYYNFDFTDPIIVEDFNDVVNASLAAIAAGNLDEPIISRVTFNDPSAPSAGTIARVETRVVNGPDIQTSGIDLRAENIWENAFAGGDFSVGADATYVLEYDVDDFDIEGTVIAGGDRAGQFNRSNFSRSLPQLKANAFANLAVGPHNFRGVVRYVDSYEDERGDITPLNNRDDSEIDSMATLDLFYNWNYEPWQTNVGLSVINVFDEDPPYTQFDTVYDPYTHNPFGRTFKVSVTKEFGLGQ